MNRRNFIKSAGLLASAFSILPSALTYERKWKVNNNVWIPETFWWSDYQNLLVPIQALYTTINFSP